MLQDIKMANSSIPSVYIQWQEMLIVTMTDKLHMLEAAENSNGLTGYFIVMKKLLSPIGRHVM